MVVAAASPCHDLYDDISVTALSNLEPKDESTPSRTVDPTLPPNKRQGVLYLPHDTSPLSTYRHGASVENNLWNIPLMPEAASLYVTNFTVF